MEESRRHAQKRIDKIVKILTETLSSVEPLELPPEMPEESTDFVMDGSRTYFHSGIGSLTSKNPLILRWRIR